MTLIVEDGTRIPNANTYINSTDFIAYSAARGFTIDPTQAEMWLIMAMDYLETLQFIGYKASQNQPLLWPRYNVVIDTWWVPNTTIPFQLPKAQCEIALQISKGNDPLQDRAKKTRREKVGSIEVEYTENSADIPLLPVKITSLLAKLLVGGGSSLTVGRA